MKRKSVTYLNQLKADVDQAKWDISQAGTDLGDLANDLDLLFSTHDLVTNNQDMKDHFLALSDKHKELGSLIKKFMKARDLYLDFF